MSLIVLGCGGDSVDSHNVIEQDVGISLQLTSHERMQERLAGVAQDALRSNEYFQTQSLQQGLTRLVLTTDPRARMSIHLELMDDYRRLGDNDKAVEHLSALLSIVEEFEITIDPEDFQVVMYEAGVSYLRKGETENCVNCRTSESCILPIAISGQHEKNEGSRRAAEFFERVLAVEPDHLKARWLLNIARMTIGEYPQNVPPQYLIPEHRFADESSFPRFRDVAAERGIKSVNCGGGAVAEDFDNDGDFDLLTSTWDPAGAMHYFENDGTGHFVDRTVDCGLVGITGGINMVQADYDNDGDVDVFVVRGAWLGRNGQYPNSLLQNDGSGKFSDVSFQLGIAEPFYPTSSAAWFDFDNDGDVDLFVANESAPCQLFRNDGASGFKEIASGAGVTNDRFSKGVTSGDVNGDRFPDIYVSNLDGSNRLYINQGNGTFSDEAVEWSVEEPLKSFPTWFWDVNNDGLMDLYVASYDADVVAVAAEFAEIDHRDTGDRLYLGQPDGGFVDASADFGLAGVSHPMGANFGDLDNDGFLDFYLGTGYPSFDALMPNLMFRSVDGRKFEQVCFSGGFAHLQKGHGTVFCDFDTDGDQDIFMQMGGAYPGDAFGDVLYQNPGFDRNWIRIDAVGALSNRSSIGARIRVEFREGAENRSIYRWVNSGGSFGANSLQQHIGVGASEQIERVEVYWPATDTTRTVENPDINTVLRIREDGG